MDQHTLSRLLDTIIDELLARRQALLQAPGKVMRVVISGDDLTTLPATLKCLTALTDNGYALRLTFSWSASQSALQAACLQALTQRGINVLCDDREPDHRDENDWGLYLPALSTNSLSKIALSISDNRVCRWVFFALARNKQVIVTLNHDASAQFAPALRTRLMNYAATLAEYGCTVLGQATPVSHQKRLLTLSDVRQHAARDVIRIGHNTLITPAARDEIRARGLSIIQRPEE
ncbi:hypothetical protein CHU32_05870 [Superficieibacter electus]|uniref:Ethanolamine utilization protein n=1 Tax=Superficieibacter electus TaxID=2022662 RepID=A0A2P5GT80_9ENTR|nr:hypothetical protein [Superficieibacter electus]POP46283.1 hypothetical protein CHU33_05855 [Superficieibacter electus]POP49753.1 hypothetical protein CHU32_05870 [Superficieibacter electus]